MKTIYTGGLVFTGELPLQEAFAVEDGRFTAVGSDADVLATCQQGDVIVPLNGRFVCPGFNDSHMHLLNLGRTMEQCDLSQATTSLDALQTALRQFAAGLEAGAWLLGRGWNQDLFAPATGMPTRQDLDAVDANRPICIVRCCGHCLTVNTQALRLLGLDESTPIPPGGAADRDEDGHLTGIFRDTAMSLVLARLPRPSRADVKRMLRRACEQLNRHGITSCHSDDLCTIEGLDWREIVAAYQELEAEGGLTVRVHEQCQLPDLPALQGFLQERPSPGPMFRPGPLKLLGDGSLGARTAFLSRDYADLPGTRGLAIYTTEQLTEMIGLCRRHGIPSAIHAIGDGMLDRVLDAYEAVLGPAPDADHHSGVVHVQITRPDQLERMQQLKLHAYVQPVFLDYDVRIVHSRVGDDLAGSSYAFHTLRQLGLHVSSGTDCPVEDPSPLRGLQCAVTRQVLDRSLPPYRPEEAMTMEEALQSYTREGAYASFEEQEKGCILPGMLADFTVLDANPFAVATTDVARIRVLGTWLGGRQVFAAG